MFNRTKSQKTDFERVFLYNKITWLYFVVLHNMWARISVCNTSTITRIVATLECLYTRCLSAVSCSWERRLTTSPLKLSPPHIFPQGAQPSTSWRGKNKTTATWARKQVGGDKNLQAVNCSQLGCSLWFEFVQSYATLTAAGLHSCSQGATVPLEGMHIHLILFVTPFSLKHFMTESMLCRGIGRPVLFLQHSCASL